MAIHTILATPSNGTKNMKTVETEKVRADSKTQGRALPARQCVRSMSWPTTRLAMTIKIVEKSCRAVKNDRSS